MKTHSTQTKAAVHCDFCRMPFSCRSSAERHKKACVKACEYSEQLKRDLEFPKKLILPKVALAPRPKSPPAQVKVTVINKGKINKLLDS